MRAIILGCGSSLGVPRIGNDWGACDPCNPRNARRRPSVLIEATHLGAKTNFLIDTPPEIRTQLLEAQVQSLDGVLLTHDHADHFHGLAELQYIGDNVVLPYYMASNTWGRVQHRFPEYFISTSDNTSAPFLSDTKIDIPSELVVDGEGGPIQIALFPQNHGETESIGIRVRDFAYSVDFKALGRDALRALEGLDTWLLDCLRYDPHPTHVNLKEAIDYINLLKPKRAVLTGLSSDLDYEQLRAKLPPNVEPAFDGMVIKISIA